MTTRTGQMRLYAYTVVGRDNAEWTRSDKVGAGVIKVGQTTRATARQRINEQIGTAFPGLNGVTILLDIPAVRADGSEFSDRDVHRALIRRGARRHAGEWFEADLADIKGAIRAVGGTHSPQDVVRHPWWFKMLHFSLILAVAWLIYHFGLTRGTALWQQILSIPVMLIQIVLLLAWKAYDD